MTPGQTKQNITPLPHASTNMCIYTTDPYTCILMMQIGTVMAELGTDFLYNTMPTR